MLLKSDQPLSKCGQCASDERRLLHHVRHRGIFRRLCTNCVLRHHPQSFCPTCFTVYPPFPSNEAILACSKCFSSSHSHCVTSYTKPYVCPLCANPNAPVFKLKRANEGDGDVDISNCGECRLMDRDAAKKLLAAAKIAMNTMNKAVVVSKGDAERRAKDAAVARKRAREALVHVANLALKDKYVKRENGGNWNGVGNVNVNGNVNVAVWDNVVKNVGDGGSRNGVLDAIVEEEKIEEVVDVERVEGSEDKVMTALGAVELKENENNVGDVGLEITMDGDDVLVMDVDEHGSISVNARIVDGVLDAEKNVENDETVFVGGEKENGEENVSKQEDVVMDGVNYEENGDGKERENEAQ